MFVRKSLLRASRLLGLALKILWQYGREYEPAESCVHCDAEPSLRHGNGADSMGVFDHSADFCKKGNHLEGLYPVVCTVSESSK